MKVSLIGCTIALLVVLVRTFSSPAPEISQLSANSVMTGCHEFVAGSAADYLEGLCVGEIVTPLLMNSDVTGVCPAGDVTVDQAVHVVGKFIDNRRALLNKKTFVALALAALKRAWPCPHVKAPAAEVVPDQQKRLFARRWE